MNTEERFKLYENSYFREVDRIEKISARLSLPFGALLAVSTILAFMLNATVKPTIDPWQQIFWVLFGASSLSLSVGAWFLRLAWFGHFDKLLPTADAIEGYHSTLEETYSGYEESATLIEGYFKNFLFDYYVRFASENAINNDKRSYNIYRALVSFTIAIMLALLAAIPFYFGSIHLKDTVNVKQNAPAASTASPSKKRQGKYSETIISADTHSTVEPAKPAEKVGPNRVAGGI